MDKQIYTRDTLFKLAHPEHNIGSDDLTDISEQEKKDIDTEIEKIITNVLTLTHNNEFSLEYIYHDSNIELRYRKLSKGCLGCFGRTQTTRIIESRSFHEIYLPYDRRIKLILLNLNKRLPDTAIFYNYRLLPICYYDFISSDIDNNIYTLDSSFKTMIQNEQISGINVQIILYLDWRPRTKII
jgi:hypothetical protein